MTKDYVDYIQTIDFIQTIGCTDSTIIDNQESSDEFYGQSDYKQYVDDWC